MSRTHYDGQAKWFQVRFCHEVVAVKTSLQYHTIQKRMLKAINAKQQGNVLMFHGQLGSSQRFKQYVEEVVLVRLEEARQLCNGWPDLTMLTV
jgi:hypothetical protein